MGGTVVAATVARWRAGRTAAPSARVQAPGQWIVVVLPVVVLVVMAWHMRWVSDDGFINLRVVEQVVYDNGPVFNAGERIEASTSALWVALLVLVHPLPGLSMPWKAALLGIVLSAVGLLAAQRASVALARPRGDQLVLPLGAIVVACLPPFWDFATSGLETGLTFAWIGTSCWWCARRVTADAPVAPRAELAGAALVSLGFLIRPDLGLFWVAFGAVLLAQAWPGRRRQRLRIGAALLALPLAYQLFRMGYYALLVPHTALAKEAGRAQWGQGWEYLTDVVAPYLLWWPLAVLSVVLVRQVRRDLGEGARLRAGARAAPALAALVYALYMTRMGGDFMHARLLLPAVFGLLAPVGVTLPSEALRHPWSWLRTNQWLRDRLPVYAAVAVIGWALVCATWFRPIYKSSPVFGVGALPVTTDGTIEDERELFRKFWRTPHPIGLDRPISRARATPDDRTLVPVRGEAIVLPDHALRPVQVPLSPGVEADSAAAQFAIGTVAYAWGPAVYVVDLQSLAHPVGGHLDELKGWRLGHQKPVPFVWQVVSLSPADELHDADGRVILSAEDAAAARRALDCGQLGRYVRDIREPLTPGRFLGNIIDSVGNTFFRVPPDPVEAEHRFCGS